MKKTKNTLRILFIGNSHTYFNDMPAMVATKARESGFECEVTMIAHGGWFLVQHVEEPDVEMYYEDGAHASKNGSEYAAKVIWESVLTDINRKRRNCD